MDLDDGVFLGGEGSRKQEQACENDAYTMTMEMVEKSLFHVGCMKASVEEMKIF